MCNDTNFLFYFLIIVNAQKACVYVWTTCVYKIILRVLFFQFLLPTSECYTTSCVHFLPLLYLHLFIFIPKAA